MDTSKRLLQYAGRNSVKFTLAIALTMMLSTALAVSAFERAGSSDYATGGHGWASAVRNYLRNPVAYFAQRSPGERVGELLQSKHRMFKLAGPRVQPRERVLANVRYPSPLPDFINDIVPDQPFSPFITPPFEPSLSKTPTPPPSIFPPPVISPVPFSPSGGISPVNAAVPEPATWFMLIWGMALVGTGLRASRRRGARAGTHTGVRERN